MNKDAENIIVSIQCLVYNHEPYLRQCLDGFVMQKTNFKFEAIVHDDVSTDGSAKIIAEYAEKYPDIIKPIYETENQYSKRDGSLEMIMNNASRGKYIAICEGDDYWTDPFKLQKQFEYMEGNVECVLVWGRAKCYYQDKNLFKGNVGSYASSFDDLIVSNSVCTLTSFYRKDALRGYNKLVSTQRWLMGDYPMWLYMATRNKIYFMDDDFGVYRILHNSASHSKSYTSRINFLNSTYQIRQFFLEYLGREISQEFIDRWKQDTFSIAFHCREYETAIQLFKKYKLIKSGLKSYLKYLLSAILVLMK